MAQFGNKDRGFEEMTGKQKVFKGASRWNCGNRGQAAVEMAVVLPVLLAVVGIAINLMVFLGDCARFDRVAAEAVRTQAASPGYGQYGTSSREAAVKAQIERVFDGSDYLSFSVAVSESGTQGNAAGDGITFSLNPRLEVYICTMNYRPWGFGNSFFGIQFSGISHTRHYVIDPYRPGVLF